VRPSMGFVGDAYDNALCESFVATLECELLEQHCFRNQAEARMAVFDSIEGWYNPHRRHSGLVRNPLSPSRGTTLTPFEFPSGYPSTIRGQLQGTA